VVTYESRQAQMRARGSGPAEAQAEEIRRVKVPVGEPGRAQAPASARALCRRREELGKFLRARRARLAPEDFGMPGGSRRRTPGLRREELALLAGVGVTWYTWLEQGRTCTGWPRLRRC
jgi:hypothetical protein